MGRCRRAGPPRGGEPGGEGLGVRRRRSRRCWPPTGPGRWRRPRPCWGWRRIELLGYPDGESENDLGLRAQLVEMVRRLRPDTVVCPDPTALYFGAGYVNHRDHRICGFAVLDTVAPAAASPLYFPDRGPPHQVQRVYLSGTLNPDTAIDIGPAWTASPGRCRATAARWARRGSGCRSWWPSGPPTPARSWACATQRCSGSSSSAADRGVHAGPDCFRQARSPSWRHSPMARSPRTEMTAVPAGGGHRAHQRAEGGGDVAGPRALERDERPPDQPPGQAAQQDGHEGHRAGDRRGQGRQRLTIELAVHGERLGGRR